jgi:uncharacterized protein YbjT (DUF2867 family)
MKVQTMSTVSGLTVSPLRVLVVGATGFLGAKVLGQLQAMPSLSLCALSRRGAPAGSDKAVEWRRGDLMDRASLDQAMIGVDVVVTSANGYMKETIAADFAGNKNLIEAAARAGVKRFVFLSIVACDQAPDVPHFHAKKVAEDLIRTSGLPYVFIRAPAFLDQADDYLAKGLAKRRFYGVGDRDTRWSYVLTDDLAQAMAQAATHPDPAILNQTIDISWRDGPQNQRDLSRLAAEVTGKPLSLFVVPWWVLRLAVKPICLFSELGYDLLKMMLFFKKGTFVANTALQERFFGPAPTARDALMRWIAKSRLM